MWIYEKKLQYPIRIKNPDPRMAQVILTQYGGPDGKCLSGGKLSAAQAFAVRSLNTNVKIVLLQPMKKSDW